jgi:Poxvirus A22 protein
VESENAALLRPKKILFEMRSMKVLSIDVGTRNFAAAVISRDDSLPHYPFVIEELFHLDLLTNQFDTAMQRLIDAFEEDIALYDVDYVLLESQAKSKAVMKKIQAGLFAHFYTLRNAYGYKIKTVHGKFKFQVYKGIPVEYKRDPKPYRDQKNKLIAETEKILKDKGDSHLAWIQGLKKKDDVCDCIMQGLYFIL